MKKTIRLSFAILMVLCMATSCSSDDNGFVKESEKQKENIETVLDKIPDVSIFSEAFKDMDFSESDAGNFTVFAVKNEGFISPKIMKSDASISKTEMKRHIAEGHYTLDDLKKMKSITVISGEEITITIIDNNVYLNGVKLGNPTEDSGNIIFIIDEIIPAPISKKVKRIKSIMGYSEIDIPVSSYFTYDKDGKLIKLKTGDGTPSGTVNGTPSDTTEYVFTYANEKISKLRKVITHRSSSNTVEEMQNHDYSFTYKNDSIFARVVTAVISLGNPDRNYSGVTNDTLIVNTKGYLTKSHIMLSGYGSWKTSYQYDDWGRVSEVKNILGYGHDGYYGENVSVTYDFKNSALRYFDEIDFPYWIWLYANPTVPATSFVNNYTATINVTSGEKETYTYVYDDEGYPAIMLINSNQKDSYTYEYEDMP